MVAATKILTQQLLGVSGWVHALPFTLMGPEAMDTLGAKPKQATEQDRIVGARIQMLRKSKGLSQTALGSAVGVTFQQVQKYENGQNRVGAGRLSEIARLLEVPVSAFFEEGDSAVAREQTELFGILRTYGAIDLLRAFATIEDAQLRSEVLAIVRSASRLGREQSP